MRAFAPATVLALAAVAFWWPHSSITALSVAAFAVFAATLGGARAAETRARLWWPPLLALLLLGMLTLAVRLLSSLPVPGWGWAPEIYARALDALLIAGISATAAFWLAFFAGRHNAMAPITAAAAVVAVSTLFAAHRGGSIHLPRAVSDLAWTRGWHPGRILAAAGIAIAVWSTWALFSSRRSWRSWAQFLMVLLLGALVFWFSPRIGLFDTSMEDPLGLSGKPEQQSPWAGGKKTSGEGMEGEGAEEADFDFRDEYPRGSPVPVAVVVLEDDVEPFGGMFYFRQTAFSRWNGRKLVRTYQREIDGDLFESFPDFGPLEKDVPGSGRLREDVPAIVALMTDHRQPPVLSAGRVISPMQNPDPSVFQRAFRSLSEVLTADPAALLGSEVGHRQWSASTWEVYRELPPDPRYRELAAEIIASLPEKYRQDPWARVLGAVQWFSENTRYSIRPGHASAGDPAAAFLFGSRIGYCVHVSHAMAYLTRAMGLPSRVAVGYAYPGENRHRGSAILLRSGDAHAWAEVFLRDVGWVPVDPPMESLDPEMPVPDMDLQNLLGEMAREQFVAEPGLADGRSWPRWQDLATLAALLFLLWVGLGWLLKFARAIAPHWARRDRRARLALRAATDRLADLGVIRDYGQSREAFADEAARWSPSYRELTALHLAAVFGRRPVEAGRARALARTVNREIRRSGGRALLWGTISPWRWLKTR